MLQIESNKFLAYLRNCVLQHKMLDLIVVQRSFSRELLVLFSNWIRQLGSSSGDFRFL